VDDSIGKSLYGCLLEEGCKHVNPSESVFFMFLGYRNYIANPHQHPCQIKDITL